MKSKTPILLLLTQTLSFNFDTEKLKQKLSDGHNDWEEFVKVGSAHLILPTLFCRLNQKKLLNYIPEDLKNYLQEITRLNRDRNVKLLEEINEVSDLLNKHNIDYVFIKGAALLAGGYYQDLAERMIGDIDILIHGDSLDFTFNLLVDKGYDRQKSFNYNNIGYRHRPRLISETKLGAIEIHSNIINYTKNKKILLNNIFKNKLYINKTWIPNPEYANSILIYSQQINNHGFILRSINLKYLYDSILLKEKPFPILTPMKASKKYIDSYLFMLHKLFYLQSVDSKMFTTNHLWYTTQVYTPKFYKYLNTIKFFGIHLNQRIKLFYENASYRRNILNKLIYNSKTLL